MKGGEQLSHGALCPRDMELSVQSFRNWRPEPLAHWLAGPRRHVFKGRCGSCRLLRDPWDPCTAALPLRGLQEKGLETPAFLRLSKLPCPAPVSYEVWTAPPGTVFLCALTFRFSGQFSQPPCAAQSLFSVSLRAHPPAQALQPSSALRQRSPLPLGLYYAVHLSLGYIWDIISNPAHPN